MVSCEPNDWNLILDGIGDVTNLSVTHPSAEDAKFSYTLPEDPLSDLSGDDRNYDIYFYYSPAGSETKTYIGNMMYDETTANGDTDSTLIDMTFYALTDLSEYTFTLHTMDGNQKPSDGASQTITW